MKERLLDTRKMAGLSQDAFGRRIGVTGATVSRLESGERKPTDAIIISICREYGINREWLELGIGPMRPSRSDADIELLTSVMCGQSENKKKLIRILAEMPDELLEKMMVYLESKIKSDR